MQFWNYVSFKNGSFLIFKNQTVFFYQKKELYQKAKGYHGTTLEGPACRHLLNQSNTVIDPNMLGYVEQDKVPSFIRTSKTFIVLVHECFRTDIVNMKKVKKILPKF